MSDITMNKKCGGVTQDAFTFLEVMIALSVIAIVLVGIYRLQSQTILMSIRSRFDTVAPFLAQQKLSEIEMDPYGAKSGTGGFGDAFAGYNWRVSITDMTSEMLGRISENIKQIHIEITFQEEDNVYNLRTYRLIEGP